MQNNPDYDQWYLSQEMKQAPVITHAPNHNIYHERGYYRGDDTSILNDSNDDNYEYSQPQTIIFRNGIETIQANNPFGTPAQYAVLFVAIKELNDVVAIQSDWPIPTNFTPSATNFTTGQCWIDNVQVVPQLYWTDFQQFVSVFINAGAIGANVIIAFRRKREQIIPTNKIPYNELSQ